MTRSVTARLGTIAALALVSLGMVPVANAATSAMFANVSASGALNGGSNVTSVTKLGVGAYEVSFAADVTACAYVATTVNVYSQAVQVFTAGGHVSGAGVYVETKNQGGGLTDAPFHLVVDCGTLGMKYAVVGYSGSLVRGTAGTTVTPLGSGRYNVTFPAAVKTCAFIATVGDPANGLVYSPAHVFTSSGANANTVYIETKNPGGGLADGTPFHLAVICNNAKTHYGVVNASGLMSRGSSLTSSFNAATGRYMFVTNANVNPQCATVATRGMVDTAAPYAPTTMELVPGGAANTMGIDVRELGFFGGKAINQAFHVASVCR